MTDTIKKPRGFAAISPERHRDISRAGGRAAHEQGVAHRWTKDEARRAGSLGGRARAKQVAAAIGANEAEEA